ncbi:ubiquinone biosynthesis methyltransferase UbiE [uncultured Roseibium sp.]|uniref:ubiquinone biosynthesis methyltransferase UbiE n=1 Tax=uncultured Roseibium sp. TaxID=1936171 RepID=UPI0026220E52|nr:ubiquinone biosynthesis methyltransferase UbiE [uncultured Roseibium sp.]
MPSPSEGVFSQSDLPQMLQMDLNIEDFCSDWSHCDLMSAYLARMVSHNRLDSLLFSNLYSSAVNELMETVFRMRGKEGTLQFSVHRKDNIDRIELVFPVEDDTYLAYQDAIGKVADDNAEKLYLEALFAEAEPDASLGLLELGVDYGARLTVDRFEDGRMQLTAEMTLEEDKK